MSYKARVYYTAAGAAFAVPFPFLERLHVHLYLNGVELNTNEFTWTSDTLITLDTAKSSSSTLLIVRQTPGSTNLHVIQRGVIDPPDVNENDTQLLYLIQEREDEIAVIAGQVTGGEVDLNGSFGSYAALEAATPAVADAGNVVALLGATTPGDLAGGLFHYGTSATIPEDADGAIVVQTATPTVKAKRIISNGEVGGDWFKLSQDPADRAANATKLAAIFAYAAAKRLPVKLPRIRSGESPFYMAGSINATGVPAIYGAGDYSYLSWGEDNGADPFTNLGCIYFGGTYDDLGAIVADRKSGYARQIDLTTTPSVSLSRGDILFGVDKADGSLMPGRAYYLDGEFNTVADVTSNTDIDFINPLEGLYDKDTSEFFKMNPVRTVLEGFRITGRPGATDNYAVFLKLAGPGTRLNGLTLDGANLAALGMLACLGVEIIQPTFNNLLEGADDSHGYGIDCSNSSNIKVLGGGGRGARHWWTAGGQGTNLDLAIPGRHNQVIGTNCGIIVDAYASPSGLVPGLDTHGNQVDTSFRLNTIYGGVNLGGFDIKVEHNTIISGSARGYVYNAINGAELGSFNHSIVDNIIDVIGVTPNAGYGGILDIGGPGSALTANTPKGGRLTFSRNKITSTITGASSSTHSRSVVIVNNGCAATDLVVDMRANTFQYPASDADSGYGGGIFVNAASGADFAEIDIRGHDNGAINAPIDLRAAALVRFDGPPESGTIAFTNVDALSGILKGSSPVDPGSLAAGVRQNFSVTVTGARVGMEAKASFSVGSAYILWLAEVESNDTVVVTQWNTHPTDAVDLGSGTIRVWVEADADVAL